MNRALGFGVLSGGILTGMVAAPAPASAHYTEISTGYGHMWVYDGHGAGYLRDVNCADPNAVYGEFKTTGGGPYHVNDYNCDAAATPFVGQDGTITVYRKCVFGPDLQACSGWVGA